MRTTLAGVAALYRGYNSFDTDLSFWSCVPLGGGGIYRVSVDFFGSCDASGERILCGCSSPLISDHERNRTATNARTAVSDTVLEFFDYASDPRLALWIFCLEPFVGSMVRKRSSLYFLDGVLACELSFGEYSWGAHARDAHGSIYVAYKIFAARISRHLSLCTHESRICPTI